MSASRIVNTIAVRAAWQIDVPRYPAKPKRYLPAQFVLGREQDVVCAQGRGDPKPTKTPPVVIDKSQARLEKLHERA